MQRKKIKNIFLLGVMAVLFSFPVTFVRGQEEAKTLKTAKVPSLMGAANDPEALEDSKESETPVSKSELDKLKMEWEAVREQQVQMIREKEDQLEKLKEELFSKMKTSGGPAVSNASSEFEAQKAAFQVERQKLFAEMSRQKESLRQLQFSLEEKAKQLAAERNRFEQEKKTAAR